MINSLLLAIGNSRLHWAWVQNSQLVKTWHTSHLVNPIESKLIPVDLLDQDLSSQELIDIPIKIASVVPSQTQLWQNYNQARILNLSDIKITNIYPTLGIDRALAVWGGGEKYDYPCLIIDGGTALTFTGVNEDKRLMGGAILPGLRSQFLNLKQKTAALPQVDLPNNLPPRWALDTNNAIASGIIYTVIASIYSYIQNWQQQYSHSQIIITGGDGKLLRRYLQQQYLDLTSSLIYDGNLIFHGMNLIGISANDRNK